MKPAAAFQQRTADYAFRRLWTDADPTHRFLVADEVGLGKTVVAREVVRRTIEHLSRRRLDIIYICSSVIASQNLVKLQGERSVEKPIASRLTLLATHPRAQGQSVRFLSLTPGTSFKIVNSTGWIKERALIWMLLRRSLRPKGLEQALRMVSPPSWDSALLELAEKPPQPKIAKAFYRAVRDDIGLVQELRTLARDALIDDGDRGFRQRRRRLIGKLRAHLARVSVQTLARNGLVILDEFQRFSDLLRPPEEHPPLAVELMSELLSTKHAERRVLLLSATPYRMPGLDDAPGEQPYADLVDLARFLTNSEIETGELERALRLYALTLQAGASREADILAARDAVQLMLRKIMARTERVSLSNGADAMVSTDKFEVAPDASDLRAGIAARRIARRLKSHDTGEYWKSAPYLLDFMRDYDLKRRAATEYGRGRHWIVRQARAGKLLLERDKLRHFSMLDFANPRLRALITRVLPLRTERLLWLPPTMPYTRPSKLFATAPRGLKALVFCEWQVAQEAIASLVTFEVERRLLHDAQALRHKNSRRKVRKPAYEKYRLLGENLRFASQKGEKEIGQGLVPLALLYPSATLVRIFDPLTAALASGGELAQAETVGTLVRAIREKLKTLDSSSRRTRSDTRWYWAAPALLDGKVAVQAWLRSKDPLGFRAEEKRGEAWQDSARISEALNGLWNGSINLGRKPRDLPRVLAELAIGAPGICARRALERTFKLGAEHGPALTRAAFKIARGFQALFNQPEAGLALLLETRLTVPYWRQVLEYAIGGNIQSLLDEQCHLEADGLALLGDKLVDQLDKAATTIAASTHLRYAATEIAGFGRRRRQNGRWTADQNEKAIRMRGRHAVRFAEIKDEEGTARLDAVRTAFNSPFRPFVLASTTVGQEGLDFHPWCHTVWHWNLPRNPIVLEQREGRVHRYKGHAVRLNVVKAIGLKGVKEGHGLFDDVWEEMFRLARDHDDNELAPYWMFESCSEPVRVSRVIPLPCLSRETEAWPRLRRRLTLYRLVLGQPRQEDLLAALDRSDITEDQARRWRIDLSPPRTAAAPCSRPGPTGTTVGPAARRGTKAIERPLTADLQSVPT
jgi:hypothetical protein